MNSSRSSISLIGAGLMVGVGLGLVILAAIGWGGNILRSRASSESDQVALEGPADHVQAPDFTLRTPSGTSIKLSDLQGKVVLINFWATWCGPCKQEMPLIEKYYQQYAPNLVVLAINNDEPATDVQAYVADMKLSFPVLLDPGEKVETLYRIRAFPTSFFLNTKGIIQYQHIGVMNEGQLVQYLKNTGVGE